MKCRFCNWKEDPEEQDSEVIRSSEFYLLWHTPYKDHCSYWISDLEGYELEARYELDEALEMFNTYRKNKYMEKI